VATAFHPDTFTAIARSVNATVTFKVPVTHVIVEITQQLLTNSSDG
jgi:hypothetical protein